MRWQGLDVYKRQEELIKRAVDGTVPVYHHTGAAGGESVSEGNDSIGRTIYKLSLIHI